MGTSMRVNESSFFIKQEDIEKAYELLTNINEDYEECKDLFAIFEEHSPWVLVSRMREGHSDVIGIDFEGENYHDDTDELLECVAPFVKDGSYLQVSLNDGEEIFRWVFVGGVCKTLEPEIVWDMSKIYDSVILDINSEIRSAQHIVLKLKTSFDKDEIRQLRKRLSGIPEDYISKSEAVNLVFVETKQILEEILGEK